MHILNRCVSREQCKESITTRDAGGQYTGYARNRRLRLPCNVYREPRKNSLQQRSQRGVIVGISDETKGYKVRKENKVIVSQYVGNIETLLDAQNAQLQRAMNAGDRDDDTEKQATAVEAAAATRDGNR